MDQVVKRFEMLEAQMAAGPTADAYVKMASEYADMQEMVASIRALRDAEQERGDLEAMLGDRSTDGEMRALAEADLPEVEARIEGLRHDIQILLLPRDAADEKNAILEIRAGTGGDEAALFAGDGALLRRGAVLCRADGFTGVMALDGRGLCESAALAILPWRARGLTLGACGARGAPILIGGLLKAGRFEARTARRLGAELCLAFDPEDPQLLFLLCGEAEKDRWSSALAAQFYAAENTPGL